MNYIANIVRSDGDPKIVRSGPSSLSAADRLARSLGWLSIGLGLVELIMPGRIANALGMQGKEGLVRAYGAREIASGVLCLSPDKTAGLWSRAAGDGLDVAALLPALSDRNPKRDNVTLALAVVVGIALLDVIAAQATTARHGQSQGRTRSYRDRSGFPRGLQVAKEAAKEVRVPASLRAAPVI